MSSPEPYCEYGASSSRHVVAATEIAFGSHAGHATLPEPELPADGDHEHALRSSRAAIAVFSPVDSRACRRG